MEPAKASSRRCAIYTRKSSEEGLEQDFNSLQAQREACEAFIKSQAGEGWRLVKTAYDDGGLSGGTMERPALQRVLGDINQGLIDVVVVYKVDRLTRSPTSPRWSRCSTPMESPSSLSLSSSIRRHRWDV
jgi:site-specific DNA recombinase